MDAIRSGNNGERFQRKGLLRLAGFRWKATTFLAGNDVISELRKYMVLLITSIVGVWLVIMPVNTINTLRSERIARWMGIVDSDMCLADDGRMTELICSENRQNYYDYLEEIKTTLQNEGIDVSHVVMETQTDRLSLCREAEECRITVCNTGCSLSERELPHIFDSFFRGSNVGKKPGSGLGLSICRQLMHQMEGEIMAEMIEDDAGEKILSVHVVVHLV